MSRSSKFQLPSLYFFGFAANYQHNEDPTSVGAIKRAGAIGLTREIVKKMAQQ
jgi:hypothetical protein